MPKHDIQIPAAFIAWFIIITLTSCSIWGGSDAYHYKANFDNVAGLPPGAEVHHEGVKVGVVKDIKPHPTNPRLMQVDFEVDKKYSLPPHTIVSIASTGLMNNNVLDLGFDQACLGSNCLSDGHVFQQEHTRIKGLSSLFLGDDFLERELGIDSVYMEELTSGVKQRLTGADSDYVVAKIFRDIETLQQETEVLGTKMNTFSEKYTQKAATLQSDFKALSQMLDSSKTRQISQNITVINQKMDSWDIQKPLDHAQATQKNLAGLQAEVADIKMDLDATMGDANTLMSDVTDLQKQMTSSEGSMQYLLSEEGFSADWHRTQSQMDALSTDFIEKKYLYVPFVCRRKYLRKRAREKAANGE